MLTRRDLLARVSAGAGTIGLAGWSGATLLTGCSADDPGATGPGATGPGATDPGATDPGATDPVATDQDVAVQEVRYGDDGSQFAELAVPRSAGGPVPVAVIIHGGFWRSQFDLSLGRPLAATLAPRGWAALNIEYRRIGDGGGYPSTLDDVAAAVDLLAGPARDAASAEGIELDLDRVVTIGHSAGGHLAAWAATRPGQPADAPGGRPLVTVAGVVSQAGVLDLRQASSDRLGGGAADALLGGAPSEFPERYDVGSPIEHLPLGVPSLCVHGSADAIVPISQSEDFVTAAVAAGDEAVLATVDGDHFVVIDAGSDAWALVLDWLDERFAR